MSTNHSALPPDQQIQNSVRGCFAMFCKSFLHTKIGHDVQADLGPLFGEAASSAQASALRIAIGIAK